MTHSAAAARTKIVFNVHEISICYIQYAHYKFYYNLLNCLMSSCLLVSVMFKKNQLEARLESCLRYCNALHVYLLSLSLHAVMQYSLLRSIFTYNCTAKQQLFLQAVSLLQHRFFKSSLKEQGLISAKSNWASICHFSMTEISGSNIKQYPHLKYYIYYIRWIRNTSGSS